MTGKFIDGGEAPVKFSDRLDARLPEPAEDIDWVHGAPPIRQPLQQQANVGHDKVKKFYRGEPWDR